MKEIDNLIKKLHGEMGERMHDDDIAEILEVIQLENKEIKC